MQKSEVSKRVSTVLPYYIGVRDEICSQTDFMLHFSDLSNWKKVMCLYTLWQRNSMHFLCGFSMLYSFFRASGQKSGKRVFSTVAWPFDKMLFSLFFVFEGGKEVFARVIFTMDVECEGVLVTHRYFNCFLKNLSLTPPSRIPLPVFVETDIMLNPVKM